MHHSTTWLEETEGYLDVFSERSLYATFKLNIYIVPYIILEGNGNAFLSDSRESILILPRLEFTINLENLRWLQLH